MLMLRCILEFSIVIPAVIFAVVPVLDDLRFKSVTAYLTGAVLTVLSVFLGAYIRAEFMIDSILIILLYSVLLFISYVVLVDTGTGKKLFCFFNSTMLCSFCRLYTFFVMAPVEADNETWKSAGILTLQSCIVDIALILVIGAIFFRTLYVKLPMLMQQKYISAVWDFLFLVPLFMTVLMWWSIPIHPDLAMVGKLRPAALILLLVVLMMILLLYHILWWTAVKLTEGARLQQENTLLSMEGKRYEELRSYMDETRALRHDFRQHILVITHLAGSGNLEELRNYLQQFNESAYIGYTGYSDNIAVDAVSAYYTAFAEGQSTVIDWKLNIPHNLPMNEADYCVILGNLLENALRAVKPLPKEQRKITVISSLLSDTMIGLSVDNPYSGKLEFGKNNLPKSDRKDHGIGLTSVLNTVKRYEGSMDIKTVNNIFSVDIVFNCRT